MNKYELTQNEDGTYIIKVPNKKMLEDFDKALSAAEHESMSTEDLEILRREIINFRHKKKK